jgi:hypothetical protein
MALREGPQVVGAAPAAIPLPPRARRRHAARSRPVLRVQQSVTPVINATSITHTQLGSLKPHTSAASSGRHHAPWRASLQSANSWSCPSEPRRGTLRRCSRTANTHTHISAETAESNNGRASTPQPYLPHFPAVREGHVAQDGPPAGCVADGGVMEVVSRVEVEQVVEELRVVRLHIHCAMVNFSAEKMDGACKMQGKPRRRSHRRDCACHPP